RFAVDRRVAAPAGAASSGGSILMRSWIRWMFRELLDAFSNLRIDRELKRELRKGLVRFAVFLALLGVGGFIVAVTGFVPIKASSGHWAITEWFLNFSSERSVSTHTLGMEEQPIDDPKLLLRGAGAFDMNCRPCHGFPDTP